MLYYWANIHCFKWPNIEQIIWPSGHTVWRSIGQNVRLLIRRCEFESKLKLDCGGGLVVGMLNFYSDNPSSNRTEIFSIFLSKYRLNRSKINKRGRSLQNEGLAAQNQSGSRNILGKIIV